MAEKVGYIQLFDDYRKSELSASNGRSFFSDVEDIFAIRRQLKAIRSAVPFRVEIRIRLKKAEIE